MAHVMKSKIRIIIHHSFALATSYLLWLLLYTHLPITHAYNDTSVSFFNTTDTMKIEAPEIVMIKLQAPRAVLDTINPNIYIDAQSIPYNTTWHYCIEQKNLLVPHQVNMVHCYPAAISITKKQL